MTTATFVVRNFRLCNANMYLIFGNTYFIFRAKKYEQTIFEAQNIQIFAPKNEKLLPDWSRNKKNSPRLIERGTQ